MGHGGDMEGIWRGCRGDYGGDTGGTLKESGGDMEKTWRGHGGDEVTWRGHGGDADWIWRGCGRGTEGTWLEEYELGPLQSRAKGSLKLSQSASINAF